MQFFPELQQTPKQWMPTQVNTQVSPVMPAANNPQKGGFQSLLQAELPEARPAPKANPSAPGGKPFSKAPPQAQLVSPASGSSSTPSPNRAEPNRESRTSSASDRNQAGSDRTHTASDRTHAGSHQAQSGSPQQDFSENHQASSPINLTRTSQANDQSLASDLAPTVSTDLDESSEELSALTGDPAEHDSMEITEEPIIWFLTGQLHLLHPNSIPPLVMDNDFVQNALSADDIQEFMDTQAPVASLMTQLGLPDHKQAAFLDQTELTADQTISAHQLFASMGLNPQNIRTEIQQLQNQLPLDGLAPHMARAAALFEEEYEHLDQESPFKPGTNLAQDRTDQPKEGENHAIAASQDPFQSISQQWDSNNVTRYQGNNLEASPSWMNQLSSKILDQEQTVSTLAASDSGSSIIEPPVSVEYSGLDGKPVLAQVWQAPQEINAREMTFFQLSQEGFKPIMGGEGMGSHEQNSDSQPETRHFSQQNMGPALGTLGSQVTDRGAWEANLQRPELQRFRQEIIQRAEMLIKDGGGSIKVDLGHDQLGKIDLAIELKDQKLDIRIMAANERAREILAQELPKLREALAAHNIDLENLEIGLRQESSWSQSFEDGRQREGQSWREQQEAQSGPWQISRSEQVIREQNWGPMRPQYQGQIQVRV